MISFQGAGGIDLDALGLAASAKNSDGTVSIASANENLWNQFKSNTLPRLKDIEAQLATRRQDFVTEATDSANKSMDLEVQQAEASREALGISLTEAETASNKRLEQLGLSTSKVSAQNNAVDLADQVNTTQAAALTSVQTGLTTEALGDLSGANSLKSAREQGNIAASSAASAGNMQTIGTLGMMAMMV